MPSRFVRVRTVCVCAVALLAVACASGSTSPDDGMLPIGFAERSATPYIIGVITRRWTEEGGVRIRVHARDADARVLEAIVHVSPSVLMKWRSGRTASLRDLRVGRSVMVWSSGPELLSLPPQVAANGILVTR